MIDKVIRNIKLFTKVLFAKFSRRPLLLPALICNLCMWSIYWGGLKLVGILIVVTLPFTIYRLVKERRKEIRLSLLITAFLIILSFISSIDAISHKPIDELIQPSLEGTIYQVRNSLDGKITIYIEHTNYGRGVLFVSAGDYDIGSRIRVSGDFSNIFPSTNEGEFNSKNYYERKGISFVGYASPSDIEVISNPILCYKFINLLRTKASILKPIILNAFYEEKEYIGALILGDKSLLSDKDNRAFKICNLSHILAVSGTHFCSLLFVVPIILDSISRRRVLNFVAFTFFVIALGILTSWSSSVTRAAIMCICSYLGRDYLSGMSIATIILFLMDPFSLLSDAYLLSFLSCLGIKLCYKKINCILEKRMNKIISNSLSIYLSAQLLIIPFHISYGNNFSIISPLVSIIASLILTLICVFFVPSLMLSLAFGVEFTFPLLLLIKLLKHFVHYVSRIDLPRITLTSLSITTGILIGIFVILLINYRTKPREVLLRITSFILSISIGASIASNIEKGISITFLDVGQGDAIVITGPNTNILIDGGTYEAGESVLLPYLDYKGIRKLDYTFMTHYDKDHSGGLVYLYEQGLIDIIYTSFIGESEETTELRKSFPDSMFPISRITKGTRLTIKKDCYLEIISPINPMTGGNDDSLVIMLEIYGKKVLLTGDISSRIEDLLISNDEIRNEITNIDILKISHHGSRFSTSEEFLSLVNPECSIISVGRNNFYNHPHDETIERIKNNGCELLITSRDGAITINIYRREMTIDKFLQKAPRSHMANYLLRIPFFEPHSKKKK